jgi:hypothetical protein
MRLRANFILAITGALILLAISDASAQLYPSQRMTLVVPFPPGSATDSVTRHLAESIRGSTNITVVVEKLRFRFAQLNSLFSLENSVFFKIFSMLIRVGNCPKVTAAQ